MQTERNYRVPEGFLEPIGEALVRGIEGELCKEYASEPIGEASVRGIERELCSSSRRPSI